MCPSSNICKRHIHINMCLVTQSCPTLCDPMDCIPPGSSVHGDSLGKNTEVVCHALLQGIFPTQKPNPGLPHCRWILYQLSHQGSPPSIRVFPNESVLCIRWPKYWSFSFTISPFNGYSGLISFSIY